MDIAGSTAWVTGASSGIGRALAVALSAAGARVILSGRRADALAETAAACSGETLVLPFDAGDVDALPGIVEQAAGWTGGIDILVNNAGISQRSLAVDTAPSVYAQILHIDLLAPILLTQACLPHLIASGRGTVVAISSVAGRIGAPLRTAYSAAKHGLIGYMDSLRAETEVVHGLKVLNVLPGSVATNVASNALTADGVPQGHSDPQIDAGLAPAACADAIVAAIRAGTRELLFAEGAERDMALLRQSDPEALFDLSAKFGANIAAQRG